MPMVGYGAMVVESLLGVIALVVVGAVAVNGTKPEGTPFSIFYGCCRIFRKIRYSGTGCYRIYDDVCICTGTDLSRFCCTDRTYVVSGAVLRRYY